MNYLVLLKDGHDKKRWKRFLVEAQNPVMALHDVAAPNYSENVDTLEWGPKAEVYELQPRRPSGFSYQLRTHWVNTDDG